MCRRAVGKICTGVLEELSASKKRSEDGCSTVPEKVQNLYQTTQRHITEQADVSYNQHLRNWDEGGTASNSPVVSPRGSSTRSCLHLSLIFCNPEHKPSCQFAQGNDSFIQNVSLQWTHTGWVSEMCTDWCVRTVSLFLRWQFAQCRMQYQNGLMLMRHPVGGAIMHR